MNGIKCIGMLFASCAVMAHADVVAFKDAAKIKSWDAWNDHKKSAPPKERPCVTWAKLNKLDPGMKEIGRLAVRGAKDIKSSKWSVGCETMDRDYADWNAYKHLLEPLGAKHGRLFSGWAKTEQEKGVYDFTWRSEPGVARVSSILNVGSTDISTVRRQTTFVQPSSTHASTGPSGRRPSSSMPTSTTAFPPTS